MALPFSHNIAVSRMYPKVLLTPLLKSFEDENPLHRIASHISHANEEDARSAYNDKTTVAQDGRGTSSDDSRPSRKRSVQWEVDDRENPHNWSYVRL